MHDQAIKRESPALAIVLTERNLPRLMPIDEVPEREILLDDKSYKDAGTGDWLGFYDWLRTKTGSLVGVQMWFLEPNRHLEAIHKCRGVERFGSKGDISIYFGTERAFEEAMSNDQDFGDNKLYVGADGFVITFSAPTEQLPQRN